MQQVSGEEEPLLQPRPKVSEINLKYRKYQQKTGTALQALAFHKVVLVLIVIDATCVITDLGYTIVHPECERPAGRPDWLEVLAHVSLAITSLFLVEVPLTIWSLGLQYMNPFGPLPHAWLHLFDALVIVTTFVLEVAFQGQDSESELAGLLIILRLWRLVKLVAGVAVGAGEIDEERIEEFRHVEEELEKTRAELVTCREQNTQLQQRLTLLGVSER